MTRRSTCWRSGCTGTVPGGAPFHDKRAGGQYLTLWKDADPDPRPPAGQSEYEELESMATEIDPSGVMPRVILKATDFRDAQVLEVGAGDGRLTFQYAAESRSVVGIDTKEPDIRAALQSVGVERLGNTQFFCASATALPFSAEQFEVVLLASSL